MATKNFRSTVLEPTSEFAHGDKLRFTALATVGEVLKGSFSETTIGEDGVYSIDLQYGKHRIDYKPYEGVWRHFADIEVSADTLATTLQDLAISSVPVTDDAILVLQGILADAESAKTAAETAETAAETALAGIDGKISDVAEGYPALLAAQLSKTFYVDKTGSEENSGLTELSPLPNIQSCAAMMTVGGNYTINVGVGTYDTSVVFPAGSSVRIASTSTNAPVSGLISGGQALTEENHTCLLVDRKGNLSRGIFGTNLSFYNILIRSNLAEGDILAAGYETLSRRRIVGADRCSYTVCGYISDDYDETLQASSGAQGNPVVAIGIEGLSTSGKIDNVFGGNSTQKNVLILSANSVSINSVGSSGTTEIIDKSGYLAVIGA